MEDGYFVALKRRSSIERIIPVMDKNNSIYSHIKHKNTIFIFLQTVFKVKFLLNLFLPGKTDSISDFVFAVSSREK